MPGDYLFPKTKLDSIGDVLDPFELNQNIQPAGERLNGYLNQHNVKAPLPASVSLETNAFLKPHQAATYVVSGLSSTSSPSKDATGVFTLQGESSWRVVTDATVTLTSGVSMLMMWASAWYCYQFADTTGSFHDPDPTSSGDTWAKSHDGDKAKYYRAAVQFALRIDGTVIPETITGRIDTEQAPFYPYRIVAPRLLEARDGEGATGGPPAAKRDDGEWVGKPLAANAPAPTLKDEADPQVGGRVGPQSRRLPRTPHGMNYPCFPIRIGYNILADPGSHTVELVARRVANRHKQTEFVSKVNVYSRQLVVLDSPLEAPAAALPVSLTSPVTVAEFEPEDTLSMVSLATDRVHAIKDAYNSIEAAQMARGALNNYHIGDRKTILKSIREVAGEMVDNSAAGALYPDTSINRISTLHMTSGSGGGIGFTNIAMWRGIKSGSLADGTNHGTTRSLGGAPTSTTTYDDNLYAVEIMHSSQKKPDKIVQFSRDDTTLFATSTNRMLLVVIANVELTYLGAPQLGNLSTDASSQYHTQAFAGFGIALRFVGDSYQQTSGAATYGEYYLYGPSEAIINCGNYYDGDESGSAVDMRNVSTDATGGVIHENTGNLNSEVSLLAFFDLSDDRAGMSDIADIAVIGGVNGSAVGQSYEVEARVNRSSIFAFAIDAGGS